MPFAVCGWCALVPQTLLTVNETYKFQDLKIITAGEILFLKIIITRFKSQREKGQSKKKYDDTLIARNAARRCAHFIWLMLKEVSIIHAYENCKLYNVKIGLPHKAIAAHYRGDYISTFYCRCITIKLYHSFCTPMYLCNWRKLRCGLFSNNNLLHARQIIF